MARGVEDFVFLSVGTGLGAGLVLRGELHRGRHGAAGEVDLVAAGRDGGDRPVRGRDLGARRAARGRGTAATTTLRRRTTCAGSSPRRAHGDPSRARSCEEEARRIALHIAPISAVTDIALVVLGGGIGVNADLLLDPIRDLLTRWLPYPPRVEVSSLGDAAVLTGALAVGLRSAVDNVFANRALRT